MEHLTNVFSEGNPDVEIHLEQIGAACNEELLNGNFNFGLVQLTPEEKLLNPDALDFHIGYTPALFNMHREIGIEFLAWDDVYNIFSGEINNWSELGGADVDIIPVAAEGTFPWVYVNHAVLGDGNWREDMVYLDSLEEVEGFVDETWGAIGITGTRMEPEHIIAVGIDGVPVNYETVAQGEYPMQWPNVLTCNRQWEDMSELEHQFIEFIYSDEGWENIWAPKYVPWYKDFGESNVTEERHMRVAHTTSINHPIRVLADEFMAQHQGWIIETDGIGGISAFEALKNGETDVAIMGFTSEDKEFDQYLDGMTGHLIGYMPAFFWSHGDLGIEGLRWDTFAEILYGDITNWSEVGGPDEDIVVVIPEPHVVYDIIRYEFFGGEELPDHIIRVANEDKVIDHIEGNHYALGIGGVYASPDYFHWMWIDGVELTGDTLRSGEYRLRWSYLYITDGPPDEFQQAFLDFIYSEEGVQIRWDTGIAPNW
jgi:phosphate transport system substrate-binding protein